MRATPLLLAFLFTVLAGAPYAHAQEVVSDTVTFEKAKVTVVVSQHEEFVFATNATSTYQTIEALVLDGNEKGKTVKLENDYLILKEGDVFYLRHTVNALDGKDLYAVSEPYRLPVLWFFVGLFLLCLFVFGGKQGVRGLLALAAGLLLISYVLLPGILAGHSPVLLSISVASVIIIVGSYITHGFNRTTTAAVAGMLLTVALTGALAYGAIHFAKLSGYTNEETVYLNFNTKGAIDFVGLLFGGIMIGLLGVLYDAAISQAIVVEELLAVGKGIDKRELFGRALRIGREHIGALVNILAIAYVGASLPLLLLFEQVASKQLLTTINQEMFATEILRAAISSIGIILAVPLTTLVSVWMLHGKKQNASPESRSHSHSHR